jgi:hypothetical protein
MTSKSYIFVCKNGTPASEIDKMIADVTKAGGVVGHRFEEGLLGFSAEIPTDQLSMFIFDEF